MRGIIPVQAKNLHSAEIELIAIAMAGNEADEHTSATASVLRDLSGTREEVARAREAAVKAWLSSMPLGEELERLRAELAAAKNRLAATAAEIGTLKSAVESTNDAIVARKEEAGEKRAAAEELRRRVDRGRDELRRLRSEVAAAREEKKQHAVEWRVLVRRQVARALQLAERAVAAETHALAWSAAAAAEQPARAPAADAAHHDVVALPARTLEELRSDVEAEERKAEARVDEAEALRRAAKACWAAAAARLAEARARKREAAEQERRRDTENEHDDNTARRSRSGGSRLAVRKLPSWLCAIGRSGGLSQATAMAAPPRMAQTDER